MTRTQKRFVYPVLVAATLCTLLAAGYVWRKLGRVYQEFRQGDARTMKAYREAVERDARRGWMQADASVRAAEALLNELKTDEALEVLDSNSEEYLKGLAPSWRVRIIRMRAKVLAAQGKEDEARDAFRRARAIEVGE